MKQLQAPPHLVEEKRRVTHKEEVGGGNYYLAGKNISGTGLLAKASAESFGYFSS
jgi:hypothetical protein